MRATYLILTLGFIAEMQTKAAVESLGEKASITIPNTWTISERTATTLAASSPSEAVQLAIGYEALDQKSTITGGTYEEWNKFLEWYLNSLEVDMMITFTGYGYPITEISNDEVFSAGITSSNDLYGGRITRNYSIFVDPTIYSCSVTTQLLTDGAKIFAVRLIIYDWVSQSETEEAIRTINSLKSTNINLPLSDSDGDGLDNFDEIILYGSDPNSPDIPQSTTYQGPTITSDLNSISTPVSQSIIPYAVTTNFGANYFAASGLPTGTKINKTTGVITGVPKKKGTYRVKLTAQKSEGRTITQSVMATKIVTVF
jgi:hypothetical protein